MRGTALLLTAFAAVVLVRASAALPAFGDPDSPAATHVSPRYIESGPAESGGRNIVTTVLADYRGYDTLGETTVIVAAGLACMLIAGAGAAWGNGRGPR